MLFAGYTPIFAGTMGLALVIVLILGAPLAALIGPFAFRVVFWIALGLACSAFAKVGIVSVMVVIAVLAVLIAPRRDGRETLRTAVRAMADGAIHAMPVGVACALVGVIIGSLTLTGGATTFAGYIVQVGGDSLFLSLVLTMLTCLVLGMGIPTIPNYIITSSLAAPILLHLGVPLIAHGRLFGVIHVGVGKVSFETDMLRDNTRALLDAVVKAKPATAKGKYVKKVNLAATMSPGVLLDEAAYAK